MTRPDASAVIKGSSEYPGISGIVDFYRSDKGTVVSVSIKGLPHLKRPCTSRIFGFHIHEGGACEGDKNDPFAKAMAHFDKGDCDHPYHSGDLPPLPGAGEYGIMSFLTDRFSVDDIIGRTVIIHEKPDDLITQPSGNAGKKIACGVIKAL